MHPTIHSFVHSFILSFLQFHVESIKQQLERNTPDAQCYMLESYYSVYAHTHYTPIYNTHYFNKCNRTTKNRKNWFCAKVLCTLRYVTTQYNTIRYDVESTLTHPQYMVRFLLHTFFLFVLCVCLFVIVTTIVSLYRCVCVCMSALQGLILYIMIDLRIDILKRNSSNKRWR